MTGAAAIFASDSVLDPAGELSTTAVSSEPAYIPPLTSLSQWAFGLM
jgi:hypothetical protein